MSDEKQICDAMQTYWDAFKALDFATLKACCTDAGWKNFTFGRRLGIRLLKLIRPLAWRHFAMSDMNIDEVNEDQAIVRCAVDAKNVHKYERTMLRKVDGAWKIDARVS